MNATLLSFYPKVPCGQTFPASYLPAIFSGVWSLATRDKRGNLGLHSSRCDLISKHRIQAHKEEFQSGRAVREWQEEVLKNDKEREALKVSISNEEITARVEAIRSMLGSLGDGEITGSAYDAAWVALVEDIHGSGGPQFPSCLQWIIENQLPDGSWGDPSAFFAHDRLLNTLACMIALKSWNIFPEGCDKGMLFIRENMCKLESENAEHMPIAFEIAFPSLIETARKLDIQIPEDSPGLQEIYVQRNLKLTRIPMDVMHAVPTTLLHTMEGMPGLDWEKLLKLQFENGSFLFSPSSTAFVFMHTKDKKCLEFLERTVERFNGGVPSVYPVDMFEHIWVVDRLERLGISRYFQAEIKECLDYVRRYWTEDGICWARNSRVHDIDDTAMGFRLLRLHGHEVSPDAFRQFKEGDEFFCFAGQSSQAVTGMFNLYRASQVLFPGEKILEAAKSFSSKILRKKQASNQIFDKWIITKNLPGEVKYALDIPWYASLPRLEARFYLQHYGGADDIWIGKTLYRMPYVSNNDYLELAKLDFNNCQALHQLEWAGLQKWYRECNLVAYGVSSMTLLQAYFLAAASVFEPERATERLAWVRTAVLIEAVSLFLDKDASSVEQRRAFLDDFNSHARSHDTKNKNKTRRLHSKRTGKELVDTLLKTLNCISQDTLVAHGKDVHHHLQRAWETWLSTCLLEKEEKQHKEAELLVYTINLCAGRFLSDELLSHPHYERLVHLTNTICHHLRRLQNAKVHRMDSNGANTSSITTLSIETDMQELVQCVLQSSDGINLDVKQTFLSVTKSFYYAAHCTPTTINLHIAMVLFERVA